MQLTLTVITYSLIPPPHLIDYSPIIRRPFSRRLLLAFVVACCPFLSSSAARICRHLPPFIVILVCRPLLSSFVVRFCRPSRLLLLSIVVARRSHLSSFFNLRCCCLPIFVWQNMYLGYEAEGLEVDSWRGNSSTKKVLTFSPAQTERARLRIWCNKQAHWVRTGTCEA